MVEGTTLDPKNDTDCETIATYLGMNDAGSTTQHESAVLYAELKTVRAITGQNENELRREINSSHGTRETMSDLYRKRPTPLDLATLK